MKITYESRTLRNCLKERGTSVFNQDEIKSY